MDINSTSLLSGEIPYTGITFMNIIYAVLVLVIGYIVLKTVLGIMNRTFTRIKLPEIVASTIMNLVKAFGWILIILAVASALGIQTGSVILGLSAVIGLIVGFGMQDTISNLAAGIWLAVYRPFNIGDAVEIAGKAGVVKNISIMAVELHTFDNIYVFIPNKNVWGSVIVNYTRNALRRVEVVVGVAYGTDLDKAVKIILDTVKKHPDVVEDPVPQVLVSELADSSINLTVRAWTTKDKFVQVKSDLIKMIYDSFRENGVEIPFPQVDVHIRDMPK